MEKRKEKRKDNKGVVLRTGEAQRKNGTYYYRYQTKYHKTKCVYAKTLKELREKELKISHDLYEGHDISSKKMTINDVFEIWKKVKRGLKPNTFDNYVYMYEKFVLETFGKIPLKELRNSDVKAFYIDILDNKKMQLHTLDCIHTVVHQVLEIAVKDDYIRINPSHLAMAEISKEYSKSKKKYALTKDEENTLVEFVKNGKYQRWYPLLFVLLNTGLRIGEATGLQWDNIDFENNTIEIKNTLVYHDQYSKDRTCVHEMNSAKTHNSQRIIPMIDDVRNALLLEKKIQEDLGLKCLSSYKDKEGNIYDDYVFLNRDGRVLNQSVVNKAWHRIRRDCNENLIRRGKTEKDLVKYFSSHTLRHTFCTRLVEAGINIKAIQSLMGHADIKTTMDIYADATDDLKKAAIKEYDYYRGKIKNLPDTYSNLTQDLSRDIDKYSKLVDCTTE